MTPPAPTTLLNSTTRCAASRPATRLPVGYDQQRYFYDTYQQQLQAAATAQAGAPLPASPQPPPPPKPSLYPGGAPGAAPYISGAFSQNSSRDMLMGDFLTAQQMHAQDAYVFRIDLVSEWISKQGSLNKESLPVHILTMAALTAGYLLKLVSMRFSHVRNFNQLFNHIF